ncbi:hypothetical protein B296_00050101 [Ensete ventricosum]|uniref:Uncharacterized protein n=1 Tax=Ensete ventricosum TaxID=4639 RepID=A0A426Y1A8_ENSVE|nr:hypothetical protein B296_00050101 [Ensete ventricosum]
MVYDTDIFSGGQGVIMPTSAITWLRSRTSSVAKGTVFLYRSHSEALVTYGQKINCFLDLHCEFFFDLHRRAPRRKDLGRHGEEQRLRYALGHLRDRVVLLDHSQARVTPWATHKLELCTLATYKPELCTSAAHKPELCLGPLTRSICAPRPLPSLSYMPWATYEPELCTSATYETELCTSATYETELYTSTTPKPELCLVQVTSHILAPSDNWLVDVARPDTGKPV